MSLPKILVISHNCFSHTGSNGRTLANLFNRWDKDKITQFYISQEEPDDYFCDNYYRITDSEIIKRFFKNNVGKQINGSSINQSINKIKKKDSNTYRIFKKLFKNNSFGYLGRNLVWNINNKRNQKFYKWVEQFSPDLVLLQAGDYEFMFKIALNISRVRNIPLVVYNSEDYYFKDYKKYAPFYRLYRYLFKKQFEKTYKYASHIIYSNTLLQETYKRKFDHKSTTLFTPTQITKRTHSPQNEPPVVSYLGNLGVGRHIPLIEIAESLNRLDKRLKLDLYGRFPDSLVEREILKCKSINYKGFISYNEVKEVMQKSNLIVHAENFSDFYKKDLKHAFSTKMADSLACGTPFFVYAPESLAITRYLNEKKAACIVTRSENLIQNLENILYNKDFQNIFLNNAELAVNEDFKSENIHLKFEYIIEQSLNGVKNKHESNANKCSIPER